MEDDNKLYENFSESINTSHDINMSDSISGISEAEREYIRYRRHNIFKVIAAGTIIAAGLTYYEITYKSHQQNINGIAKNLVPATIVPTTSTTTLENKFNQSNPLFSQNPTWSQDFSTMPNGNLNQSFWNIFSGPAPTNNEKEYDTNNSNNVRIQNGQLIIEAIKQNYQGYQYTSGRINTVGKENIKYGKIDVVAKLPDGVGTWPAIWLMSANNYYANLSPFSDPKRYLNDGEIDIAESIGAKPNEVYEVIHTRLIDNNTTRGKYTKVHIPNEYTAFHTYGLEWTPTDIKFTIDGNTYFNYPKPINSNYTTWPFDKSFGLTIDIGVGGNWAGQDKSQFPPLGVNNNSLPAKMYIKSINYYKYLGGLAN